MKRILVFAITVLLLPAMMIAPATAGEIIDGVVATVNHKPIFRSDWNEAICFEAFMQQKPLAQVVDADKVNALRRLIDRQLIAAQMGDAHYMQPSEEELQSNIARLRAQLPDGAKDESWQRLLAGHALTTSSLQEHLRTELQVMNFVEVRLRPSVRIQPEEVEAYYQNQVLPDLQRAGGKVVALDQLEPKIRELLTQQHMDQILDAWLHNLRQQAKIRTSVPLPGMNVPEEEVRASGSD